MPNATYGVSIAAGGVSIQKSVARSGNSEHAYEVSLPAGKVVTAWVKTDANTAACDLPAGHGYTNGNFDVYWTEAGVAKRRYGVPGTIATNALSLDGGTGDDFAASATTGIVVTKQVSINTQIDGDAVKLLAIVAEMTDPAATNKAHIDMQDSGNASIEAIHLSANVPVVYDIEGGQTNVFTGNPITQSKASNGSSTAAATLKLISLETA